MQDTATPEPRPLMERRAPRPPASLWAEVLNADAWRPQDRPPESEGWLRAHGYLPDRRQGA